jgi:hypothetical protein
MMVAAVKLTRSSPLKQASESIATQ